VSVAFPRAARRAASEAGISVIELMVTLALMTAVVPVLGPLMISSMRSANDLQTQSAVIDELRLESSAIARELRSAECIYEPTIPAGQVHQAGARLRFLTTANSDNYEVTYEIIDGRLVRTRDGVVRTVGRGVTNSSDVFTHNATPRRSVGLRFVVQLDTDQAPQQVTTTIAGRNAWQSLSC